MKRKPIKVSSFAVTDKGKRIFIKDTRKRLWEGVESGNGTQFGEIELPSEPRRPNAATRRKRRKQR